LLLVTGSFAALPSCHKPDNAPAKYLATSLGQDRKSGPQIMQMGDGDARQQAGASEAQALMMVT